MVEDSVSEALDVLKDIQDVLDEPGWTHEQYERVRDEAQRLIPIKEQLENER